MRLANGQFGTKLAMIVVAGLVAVPPAFAATTQMDAADDPQVSGELDLQTDECRRQQERFKKEVVAAGKTCLRIYTFDPSAETDPDRNYGVVWLQSNVNARRGWCAAEVFSDVDLPSDIRVETREPRSMELKRKKVYETALTVTAAGNASDAADDTTIKQTQILYPQTIKSRVRRRGNVFRLKWSGLKDEKLGFASGAEVSWADTADDPGGISFRLNYELKRGDC